MADCEVCVRLAEPVWPVWIEVACPQVGCRGRLDITGLVTCPKRLVGCERVFLDYVVERSRIRLGRDLAVTVDVAARAPEGWQRTQAALEVESADEQTSPSQPDHPDASARREAWARLCARV